MYRYLYDPVWQTAAIGFAHRTLLSLVVTFCLSIFIRRLLFGRRSFDFLLIPAAVIGTLIAIGVAGLGQSGGLTARLHAPLSYPPDSHLVHAQLTALGLLVAGFLVVKFAMWIIVRLREKDQSHDSTLLPRTDSENDPRSPFRLLARLGVGFLSALGAVTFASWLVAAPSYSLDYVRVAVLQPDAEQMWTAIHEVSPKDFDRLTQQLADLVAAPGTTDEEIKYAIDQTLVGYQAEFSNYIGAMSDSQAKDYIHRRVEFADVLPPSVCARFMSLGTKALTASEIAAYNPEIEAFLSKNLQLLYQIRQATGGTAAPASLVLKSDWRALVKLMVKMGSRNASLDYIYRGNVNDPSKCKEAAIFLKALLELDTPTASNIRNAIAGGMLAGVSWDWVKPR